MSSMTLKAKLHTYRFNVAKPEERKAYEAMVERIAANEPTARGPWMNCISTSRKPSPEVGTREVEIELRHIFENQWNTTTERVFDWYEEYMTSGMNRDIKMGHWLELTPELADARRTTLKCQYCGAQYGQYHAPVPGEFCTKCLDSEYLKPEDLKLTRLRRLHVPDYAIAELTDDERAKLMPLYVARQTTGNDSRAVAKREKQLRDIEAKYVKDLREVETEYHGFKWLHAHNMNLDNVIYYSHTDRFSFGWRTPVSPEVESAILKVISEFPYQYEIKCADGRKLENYLEDAKS